MLADGLLELFLSVEGCAEVAMIGCHMRIDFDCLLDKFYLLQIFAQLAQGLAL
jgi:hypothetical protein